MRFLCLLTLLLSLPAQAAFFEIVNRQYGTFSNDPNVVAAFDALFDDVEAQANAELPDIDQSKYLKGVANSTVVALKGLGVDYINQTEWAMGGVSFSAGADLGNSSFFDAVSGDVDVENIAGFGLQVSVLAGIPLSILPVKKLWFLDPKRLTIYANFASTSQEVEDFSFSFNTIGLHFQYRLIEAKSYAFGFFKWGGVDFTTGFDYSSLELAYTPFITEAITDTIPAPGTPTVTATASGIANVGVDLKAFTIPLELSTNVDLLRFFGLFMGLGADLSFGKAESVANVELPITVDDPGGTLGTVGATGSIDLGDSQGPDLSNFRWFFGAQFDLWIAKLSIHVQNSITQDTIGAGASFIGYF